MGEEKEQYRRYKQHQREQKIKRMAFEQVARNIEKRENYEKRKHEKEIEKQRKEDEKLIEKKKRNMRKKARDASREQRILLYSQVILQLADGFRDTSFGQFFVRSVEGYRNRLLAEHKNWSF